MQYFNLGEQSVISCEVCGKSGRIDGGGFDIHHIVPKGMGGSKEKDYIANLILLCRACHDDAHAEKISKTELRNIHLTNLIV